MDEQQAATPFSAPAAEVAEPPELLAQRVRTARAAVALLSLQLRAAEHEADLAERVAPVDHTAVREQLRQRLEGMVEQRRRELAAQRAEIEEQADRLVRAARLEAAAMLDAAEVPQATAGPPDPPVTAVAALEGFEVLDGVVVPPLALVPPSPVAPPVEDEAPIVDPPAVAEVLPAPPAPVAAGIDTVALSQAVAVAVAVALAERFPSPPGPHPLEAYEDVARGSLLRGLTHLDVLLPMVAAVIVVVILLAWTA